MDHGALMIGATCIQPDPKLMLHTGTGVPRTHILASETRRHMTVDGLRKPVCSIATGWCALGNQERWQLLF